MPPGGRGYELALAWLREVARLQGEGLDDDGWPLDPATRTRLTHADGTAWTTEERDAFLRRVTTEAYPHAGELLLERLRGESPRDALAADLWCMAERDAAAHGVTPEDIVAALAADVHRCRDVVAERDGLRDRLRREEGLLDGEDGLH